jgi:cyanophycinase-like exopeptidase
MQGERRELFEGAAVYEPKGEREFVATWWDSQGAKHPIVASVDGASLTSLWGESGRTVYSLLASGELEVVDSIKRKDGSWSEFGRTRLKRQ